MGFISGRSLQTKEARIVKKNTFCKFKLLKFVIFKNKVMIKKRMFIKKHSLKKTDYNLNLKEDNKKNRGSIVFLPWKI